MGAPVAEVTFDAETMWVEALEILSESVEETIEYDDQEAYLAEAGKNPEPFSKSKTSNWVARVGGLPTFIQHVAHDIIESGKITDVSRAIAIALSQAKKWAAKGNKQAAAAIAEWEQKRAKNAAKKVTEAEVLEWANGLLAIAEGASPESPDDESASPEEIVFARWLAEALTVESESEDNESELAEATAAATPTAGQNIHIHVGGGGEGEKKASAAKAKAKGSGEAKPAAAQQPAAQPQQPAQPAAGNPAQGQQQPLAQPGQPQMAPMPGALAQLALQPGLGRSDDRVTKLQGRLSELGFDAKQDGVYGDLTTKAVRDFQTSVGLDPTGIVDEGTVGALRAAKASESAGVSQSVVRPGSAGSEVKQVQSVLNTAGYDIGSDPNGKFDAATEKAVKEFQRDHGLKPDGVVGRHTARMIQAMNKSDRLAEALAEAVEDRVNAKNGFEFVGALARERELRQMIEACLADVHKHGYGGPPDPHPHGKRGKKKPKGDHEKGPGEPDSELNEGRFDEILHPRSRVGRFVNKPQEPRSRSQKWFETPRVAPGGMPRPLLPHGANPPEPTSAKPNIGPPTLRTQGGAFGISPKVGTDGIPQAVGMAGLNPFHKARTGNVGTMQTKDLKLALSKAREYGNRPIQKKIGVELVKRGALSKLPETVSGARHPGSPMTSKPDTIRGRLDKLAQTKPGSAGMEHGSVTDSLPSGKSKADPAVKGGPLSRFSAPLMKGAGAPKGTTDPGARSPGSTERAARFPSLEAQIAALGVGKKADLGDGVAVERRQGGYYVQLFGGESHAGFSPSGAASAANRKISDVRSGVFSPGVPDGVSAAKAAPSFERPLNTLSLGEIGSIIDENWPQVNFGARPYLDAMKQLHSHTDMYGADRGDMIVAYFLSNAATWKGPVAREVKKELKRRIR